MAANRINPFAQFRANVCAALRVATPLAAVAALRRQERTPTTPHETSTFHHALRANGAALPTSMTPAYNAVFSATDDQARVKRCAFYAADVADAMIISGILMHLSPHAHAHFPPDARVIGARNYSSHALPNFVAYLPSLVVDAIAAETGLHDDALCDWNDAIFATMQSPFDGLREGNLSAWPTERALLRISAEVFMRAAVEANYSLAFDHFSALHDCVGLRALATRLSDDSLIKAWIGNEWLETPFSPAQQTAQAWTGVGKATPWDNIDANLLSSLQPLLHQLVRDFSTAHGFPYVAKHVISSAVAGLRALASQYDVVIAIAKGGLFSGAIAQLLGMTTRVIEVCAHNQENPSARILAADTLDMVRGKRVLFVDKDIVTGASVREAMKLLASAEPAAFGVFCNLNPIDLAAVAQQPALAALRAEGVALHFPADIAVPPLAEMIDHLHERLRTPRGRIGGVVQAFEQFLADAPPNAAVDAATIRQYVADQHNLLWNVNPQLPGADAIRESIVERLERTLRDCVVAVQVHSRQLAYQRIANFMTASPGLSNGSYDTMAHARFAPRAATFASQRNIDNPHLPQSYLSSLRCAIRAANDGYDMALIVGPEGCAYAPLFEDLRMETITVNIPEAEFGGARSVTAIDDLARLRGRRVLVVEDDVQSGATLRALLATIRPHDPQLLGLYLGAPPHRQLAENIPDAFETIYVTDGSDSDADEAAFLDHMRDRAVMFKT